MLVREADYENLFVNLELFPDVLKEKEVCVLTSSDVQVFFLVLLVRQYLISSSACWNIGG